MSYKVDDGWHIHFRYHVTLVGEIYLELQAITGHTYACC
jgi:hypothetical protein